MVFIFGLLIAEPFFVVWLMQDFEETNEPDAAITVNIIGLGVEFGLIVLFFYLLHVFVGVSV